MFGRRKAPAVSAPGWPLGDPFGQDLEGRRAVLGEPETGRASRFAHWTLENPIAPAVKLEAR